MPDLSWLNEPVRRTAFIKSVITIITMLGVAVSTDQETAVQNFVAAAVVLTTVFGLFDWTKLRGRVTPDNGQ